MQINLRIITLKLLGLSFCLITACAINSHAHGFSKQNKFSDNLIYVQVFSQVVGFDKESDRILNESDRLFYKNYFKSEARLSEEQYENLKAIAYDFTDVFRLLPGSKKLNLVSLYRNKLKNSLGENAFNDFNSFVKEKIAPNTTIIKSGNMLTLGTSSISLNTGNHKLLGGSTTNAFQLSPLGGITCSVSATMTGPGVSLSGSNSECVTTNPSVTFMSSDYQPNSQYCVNGIHTINGESGPSSDCTTTPNTPRVTSVTYERINTGDLPIDDNPSTNPGGGLRIFPDKNDPSESTTINRQKIRVRAKYFQATANIRIYFRNFDPDDPSSNAAPVDDETTTTPNAGDDNRGNVDGTAATKKGRFSYPQPPNPNPFDCQPFANGVSCLTDANGEATVDFEVTMNPGDNFTVAASSDEDYLNNLTLASDGINLKDTNNLQIPVTKISTPSSNACASTSLIACRADMLTVWRKIHIEVDSMGTVQNNFWEGQFTSKIKVNKGTAQPIPLPTQLPANEDPENGVIEIQGKPLKIVYYERNLGRLLVDNTQGSFIISASPQAPIDYKIYDDDDFDGDDSLPGKTKNGDTGDDVKELQGKTFKLLQDADGLDSQTQEPKNVYAAAYIRPDYSWSANKTTPAGKPYNDTNVPFEKNLESTAGDLYRIMYGNAQYTSPRDSDSDGKNDFWVAYFIISYQAHKTGDMDPVFELPNSWEGVALAFTADCLNSSTCPSPTPGTNPPVTTTTVPQGGFGAFIFMETLRDYTAKWTGQSIDERLTAPHELGHIFGLDGDEYGTLWKIMDYPRYGGTPPETYSLEFHPEHLKILRSRVKSPGH